MAGLHAQEIQELLTAFRDNRQLPRSHMTDLLNEHFKPVLLAKWKTEIVYNQRVLFGLVEEFHHLGWYDEEVWK